MVSNSSTMNISLVADPLYDGISATRCNIAASGADFRYNQSMSRSGHYARTAISKIKLLLGNFYVNQSGGNWLETGSGSSVTITASIEYPSGTFTQIKFGGSASGTILNNNTILSDYVTISIPKGAQFWVRQFWVNTTGINYYFGLRNTSMGDAMTHAASGLSDQTLSGTVTDTDGLGILFPLAIISPITQPSFVVYGDSVGAGQGDAFDSTGNQGYIARCLGPTFGYTSACASGDQAHYYAASNIQRAKLMSYCSTAIFQYGVNDFNSRGQTAAQLETDLTTCYGTVPSNIKKTYQVTVLPLTTSTDSYVTLGNQTHSGWETARLTFVDALRAGTFNSGNYLDGAAGIETSQDSGYWVTPSYTTDGVHPNIAGIALMANKNTIPITSIK